MAAGGEALKAATASDLTELWVQTVVDYSSQYNTTTYVVLLRTLIVHYFARQGCKI